MKQTSCTLIGIPTHDGTDIRGCQMGPEAYRTAGLAEVLEAIDLSVNDLGDLPAVATAPLPHANGALHGLSAYAARTAQIAEAARDLGRDTLPVFLGGDHSISAGTVSGMADVAAAAGQPQFVLWLDAHPDFHTLHTTRSGNLHGTPVAYFTGQDGFAPDMPAPRAPVPLENICMMGLRSVDRDERDMLRREGVAVHDMRAIDEHGVARLLARFLEDVAANDGRLHVSLDVDFLDPSIAPAVGTAVPGGATYREAHLIMEMLYDSGRVTSLDLAELNPFLDERGRTARLMVELAASLFGRAIFPRGRI